MRTRPTPPRLSWPSLPQQSTNPKRQKYERIPKQQLHTRNLPPQRGAHDAAYQTKETDMTPETLPADPAGEASRLLWELRHVPDSDGSSEYPWFNYWPDGEHLLPPATWAACNELIARGQVDFCKGVAFRGTGAVAPPPGYSQRLKESFRLANFWYERHEGLSAERDALRDLIFDLRPRAEKAEAELARAKAELADLKAQRKAEHKDSLQRAIIATLETMSTMWPKGEAPSSRL
jgi:hypothetical protein